MLFRPKQNINYFFSKTSRTEIKLNNSANFLHGKLTAHKSLKCCMLLFILLSNTKCSRFVK